MANPDYASLLALIAAETDPVIKAQLEAQCYVFTDSLTDAERELFEYVAFDYVEDNPGYVDGAFGGFIHGCWLCIRWICRSG